MAETNLNKRIQSALVGRDPRRVENSVGRGTPDINYIEGWIESKWLARWPKRPGIIKLAHYQPHQRAWHVTRREAGGRVHVVLEIADDCFVFDARDAAEHLGIDWDRSALMGNALLFMRPWNRKQFRMFIDLCDHD